MGQSDRGAVDRRRKKQHMEVSPEAGSEKQVLTGQSLTQDQQLTTSRRDCPPRLWLEQVGWNNSQGQSCETRPSSARLPKTESPPTCGTPAPLSGNAHPGDSC